MMRRRLFFLMSSIVFTISSAHSVELSQEQLSAIQNAIEVGEYPVKVLEKKSEEIDRTVVLVGETHRVNKVRHECAQGLVKSFDLIGIEGARLNPEIAKELEFYYYLASFFKKDVGKYPGPIMLTHQRFQFEKEQLSPEEAAGKESIEDIHQYGFNPSGSVSVTGQPECCYNLFRKIGLKDGDLITLDTLDEVLAKIRNFLKEKGRLDLVQLEAFDPCPEEVRTWERSHLKDIRNLKWAGKMGLGWLGACALAKRCGSNSLANGLLALGGASVVVCGFIEKIQPSSREAVWQAMRHARDQIMARNILKGFSDRPEAKTMLVLFGQAHMPGILELLVSEEFSEVDLKEIEPS